MTRQMTSHTRQRGLRFPLATLLAAFITALCFCAPVRASVPGLDIQSVRNILTLNSAADDFAPRWSPWGMLYFNSEQSGVSRFYVSTLAEDGLYTVREAETGLQDGKSHSSYITFDGANTAVVGMYQMDAKQPYMTLAEVGAEAGKWGKREFIQALHEAQSFSGHPCFSPDGNTLVFVSDRDGGKGGTDIWITHRTSSGWERCLPVAGDINTSANEVSPYFVSADTLLYASNGAGGKGGYELFMTIKVAGVWQSPLPLQDLNSEYDEVDPSIAPDGSLLFASNRPGGRGGLDIYEATIKRQAAQPSPLVLQMKLSASEVVLESQVRTESFPLLPFVFYDEGSSEPRQPINIVNANPDFEPRAIRPGALNVYAELLNIVGHRLQEFPSATLQLTGCSDGVGNGESIELGVQRARVVQRFLQRVWGIDTSRIVITGRRLPILASSSDHAEGRAENRRVELRSSDKRLLAPVVLTSEQRAVRPDSVTVIVDARPSTSMSQWNLHLRTEELGRILSFQGTKTPDTVSVNMRKRVSFLTGDSIQWEFTTTDVLGRGGELHQSVPVRSSTIEYAESAIDSSQTYTLILFAFDKAELQHDHEVMLESIANKIPETAEVIVTGYTDATGGVQHNRKLATARAENVVEFLKQRLHSATFRTRVAAESELFDNRTPQGRFYSRTVQITF